MSANEKRLFKLVASIVGAHCRNSLLFALRTIQNPQTSNFVGSFSTAEIRPTTALGHFYVGGAALIAQFATEPFGHSGLDAAFGLLTAWLHSTSASRFSQSGPPKLKGTITG